jgi:AraC-like DNA-binding protein
MNRYLPIPRLQPYIKNYLVIASGQGMTNHILPDTSLVMGFRLCGQVTYSDQGPFQKLALSVITGIRSSSRFIQYAPNATMLQVVFRESGAAAFIPDSLHELRNQTVSLYDLFPAADIRQTEETLAATTNPLQAIAVVETFLLRRLKTIVTDTIITAAIQQMQAAHGNIRISTLLTTLPVSRDAFEKRFRRITGTTPKQFAMIVRLKQLIHHHSTANSLTHAAHQAGYFDQAHFIKDFRLFTGQAPQDFFKQALYW